MATTKTLTPTNETITIDAFQGEKPDYRHVADAEGKLADAVNALNSKITSTDVIAFTATHANISNAERKSVKKYGCVCVIDLAFTVDTDITGDTVELFSGLPKSITGETRFRVPHGYNTAYPPLNLAVTSQGKIINQWSTGGIRAGVWAGEAVYISAE